MTDPWRGSHFGVDSYMAEFRVKGRPNWVFVRGPDRRVQTFPTRSAARDAAKRAYVAAGGVLAQSEAETAANVGSSLAAEAKAFMSKRRIPA